MHPFSATLISIATEFIAFGVALFSLGRLKKKYFPLVVLLGAGSLNDSLSLLLVFNGYPNTVNGNVYVLFELIIIIWLFVKLTRNRFDRFLQAIVIIGMLLWITDNLVLHSIYSNNSIYRMGASVLVVLLTLDRFSELSLFNGPDKVLRTDVLLLTGLMARYSYKTFLEACNVFQLPGDRQVYVILWVILAIILIITNLLFILAILCAPRRTDFISHL